MLASYSGTGGGRKQVGRRYLPVECTALRLLEYMAGHGEKGPFSVYQLMKFSRGRWQRRDRIHAILEELVEKGWVGVVPGKTDRYRITEEGEKVIPRFWDLIDLGDRIREKRRG